MKDEAQKKEDFARSLLVEGLDVDFIVRTTGLSEERIQGLNQ